MSMINISKLLETVFRSLGQEIYVGIEYINKHLSCEECTLYEMQYNINLMTSRKYNIFAIKTDIGKNFISGTISNAMEKGYIDTIYHIGENGQIYVWKRNG